MNMDNVTFEAHKAVVLFDSEVDDRSIAALVEQIQAIIEDYHYKTVDLRLLSPGGVVSSLHYYVDALRSWQRNHGVAINTRALTAVASASAVMLSLGDHRSAGAASILRYHGVRLPGSFELTSRAAGNIQARLDVLDGLIIAWLVDRAMDIEPADWAARWPEGDESTHSIRPREDWTRHLCGRDATAGREERRDFLTGAYRELFETDQDISADVARRMGLIDFIGRPDDAPRPTSTGSFKVPEWQRLFPGGEVAPSALRRHVMIFGETGSGKTASGVMPLVNAIVQSGKAVEKEGGDDASHVACALVIDPKREIAQELSRMGHEATLIEPGRAALNVMASLDAGSDVRTRAAEMLRRTASLATSSPAAFLLGKSIGSRDPYWPRTGAKMAGTALSLVLLLLKYQDEIYGDKGLLTTAADHGPGPGRESSSRLTTDFRAALGQLAREAGIETISPTPEAQSTCVEGHAWMKEQKQRVEKMVARLRPHGFVVTGVRGDRICVDEIRSCALKEAELGVFMRWTTIDGSDNWRAVVNPAMVQDMATELPPGWAELVNGTGTPPPPLKTLLVDSTTREPVPVHDADTSATREVRVPELRRDISQATDQEKMLVVAEVGRELGGRGTGDERLRVAAQVEARKGLEQLRAAARKSEDAGTPSKANAGAVETAGLLLLTTLQDLRNGPFGTSHPWAARLGSAEDYYSDDSEWLPLWLRQEDEMLEWYGDYEKWYGAARYGWREEEGDEPPWPGPRPVFDAGTADDLPMNEDAMQEEEEWWDGDYVAGWSRWRVPASCREALERVSGTIEEAERRADILDQWGVRLCAALLGDRGRAEGEWRRRVEEKVRERNDCIAGLASFGRELRERVGRIPEEDRGRWVETDRRAAVECDGESFRLSWMAPLEMQMAAVFAGYRSYLEKVWEEALVRVRGKGARNAVALGNLVLDRAFGTANVREWGTVLEWLGKRVGAEERREIEEVRNEVGGWARLAEAPLQYAGVQGAAQDALHDFSAPLVSETLYFGCEPGWEASGNRAIDFGAHLDGRSGQSIFVFQPSLQGTDLIARALKAVFFEAVLGDERRRERGHRQPLVGYVADEFHRFITADRSHGEQSFLDTCRSFGVFCVLACQSSSSMKYVLQDLEGDAQKVGNAVSIILNNTGTKLFFRTTDPETKEWVAQLAPNKPGLARVVDARPLSTLAPGECYAVVVDGRFVRAQLEQWAPCDEGGEECGTTSIGENGVG